MGFKQTVSVFALTVGLCACGSTSKLVEFEDASQTSNLTDGEKRLWSQSEDAVDMIRRSGKVLPGYTAKQHINNMAANLYPEFANEVSLEIVKTPILNAFAFPNGKIYVHSAIIAAAENDSQLAAVVAHEVAHFTKRHSAKNRISHAQATGFAVLMNLVGIPLLGEFIGASSIAGFSRDLEREADMEAIQRMQLAGYDIREAKKIFEFMASDALANDIEASWFFASHPDLLERIENFEQYVANNFDDDNINPIYNDKEVYKANFAEVRNFAISEKLELGHYNSLINEYETHFGNSVYKNNVGELSYFAQAYRMRKQEDDLETALSLYDTYFKHVENDHESLMHAGIVCMELNDNACARKYLEAANQAAEGKSGYVKMYLKKLNKKEVTSEH
ncbi:M48 family metallopeptidase [Glaciecola sp. 1036]|uniref:M48 family metallopeptidase n=1 Tax=Alteromonadaceae TaxID=72275 RepID=UPI003D061ACF